MKKAMFIKLSDLL